MCLFLWLFILPYSSMTARRGVEGKEEKGGKSCQGGRKITEYEVRSTQYEVRSTKPALFAPYSVLFTPYSPLSDDSDRSQVVFPRQQQPEEERAAQQRG